MSLRTSIQRQRMSSQGGGFPSDMMVFKDAEVERVLLANIPHAKDYITKTEFALLTDISNWFQNNTLIESFDELSQSGVRELRLNAFNGCTQLKRIGLEKIEVVAESSLSFNTYNRIPILMHSFVFPAGRIRCSFDAGIFDFGKRTSRINDIILSPTNVTNVQAPIIIRSAGFSNASYNKRVGVSQWGGLVSTDIFLPQDTLEQDRTQFLDALQGRIYPIGGEEWQATMRRLAEEEGYTLKEGESWADEYIDYKIYGYEPPKE